MAGEQQVTVVFLEDLWKALPRLDDGDMCSPSAPTVILRVCRGGFRAAAPMVVLESTVADPTPGRRRAMNYNPAVHHHGERNGGSRRGTFPGCAAQETWSVGKDRGGELRRAICRHPVRGLGAAQRAGRSRTGDLDESCLSCHAGPAGIPGGTRAGRARDPGRLASCNKEYFMHYVRAPRETDAKAKMEAHPHYTADQLAALMAFITAEPAGINT